MARPLKWRTMLRIPFSPPPSRIKTCPISQAALQLPLFTRLLRRVTKHAPYPRSREYGKKHSIRASCWGGSLGSCNIMWGTGKVYLCHYILGLSLQIWRQSRPASNLQPCISSKLFLKYMALWCSLSLIYTENPRQSVNQASMQTARAFCDSLQTIELVLYQAFTWLKLSVNSVLCKFLNWDDN